MIFESLGFSVYTLAMTKDILIMALGAWVALVPFLGFPNTWDMWILAVSGILIIALGVVVRRGKKSRPIRNYTPTHSDTPTVYHDDHAHV